MSSIAAIARKAPVIATFDTHMMHASTREVHNAYAWHAATYVEQPVLAGLRERFIEAVFQSKTPKACLSGPFGYGKTASAIGLWSACQQAGLLAVPPISCRSLAELAQVVYDWFVFTLPDMREAMEQAYHQFLTVSADSLARRDEREFGIPFEQARAAIRDKLARGYLDFEDVSVNLVAFLERSTELAQQGGYQGLVVLVDEFQQLIGNASKGVLVALRQLVWGLRMRQMPFGLIITMDPDTERTLADRAGDILHRIKDDGLFLDIQHMYDREFPAKLWMQYSQAFQFDTRAQAAIDRPTLEALGQLCERDDLSNGPRTVLNVLQLAAARYVAGADTGYTPLTLIDDFLGGAIRFDGDRGVVPALVAELLSFPYFQRSQERSQALKLLAAFPRGCPRQVAAMYGLETVLDELNDDLRGEFVTELEEGLTLVELQRVGRPANRLNMLLRRYWMQITDQQLFAEDAPYAFTTNVLPLLFPARVHDLNGWSEVSSMSLSSSGDYTGVLEGTASTRYPLRRIGVSVLSADAPLPVDAEDHDTDLSIIFRLNLHPEAHPTIEVLSEDRVLFNLAPARESDIGLRGSLAWITHYLSPHPISAAVVLRLLHYLAQEPDTPASERDQARVHDTMTRLQEWFLAEVFPQELFSHAGFAVSCAGYGAFKEFLFLFFTRRWPSYQALAKYQQWASLMREYETALSRVAPSVRVGEVPERGTKAEIASLFEQKRHAGFESRARQYDLLLNIESWKGNEATIRFVPHPAELELAHWVRVDGSVLRQSAYHHLRTIGFAAAEVEQVFRLALARGLVSQHEAYLIAPDVPTDVELIARARRLRERCEPLSERAAEFIPWLDAMMDSAAQLVDPGATVWRLDHIEKEIGQIETRVLADTEVRKRGLRKQLLDALSYLTPSLADAASGELVKHLAALCKRFEAERQQLLLQVQTLVENPGTGFLEEAEQVLTSVSRWHEQSRLYSRWNAMAQRLDGLRQSLQRLRGDSDTLGNVYSRLQDMTAEARTMLATQGIPSLGEIGRFEATMTECEQEFQTQSQERLRAYQQVAHVLFAEIQQLFHLSDCPAPPPYDPVHDEHSFQVLFQTASSLAQRYVRMLRIQVADLEGSQQKVRLRATLCEDVQKIAQRASDPAWLIQGNPPHLSKEAVKQITALQQRIARDVPEQTSPDTPRWHLVQALRTLPPGMHEVATVLKHTNGQGNQDELLRDLLHLYHTGVLRLLVDLPEEADGEE
jgi:hypothetical protein